ncbi:PTS sugar transporter subunit IIB [Jeotgalibacillus soli]|uniref:PTS galactitol transporter subunit IIB n=1 Tax=Jeotgalibacillus soli TaxID=889306 RepID=A0A0C2W0B4_9BACL|nr:PTS sugar transporter subunit IIB [Jeotgalibacillus soli]KIL49628.1 PTS galactitol transporter subunit IIB [Jeotgalibacillus soli]
MMKKTILVACGAGIATSTVVCERVENLVKENGVQAEVFQCKITEISSLQDRADLIVSTTILPTTYHIPALRATPYITGIGMEELDQKILDHLKGKYALGIK